MNGFRVARSDPVWEAGFLSASDRSVVGPDGEAFTRTVVHHPGAVVVVPILDPSTALLLRQYRAAVGGEILEVPAGKRDVDGEAPETTAERELVEELGYLPGRLVELAQFYNSPGFCDEYTHLFAALDLHGNGRAEPVGPEERAMTVERVAFDDLEALIGRGELVDAKSIIGLLLARQLVNGGYGGFRI